MAINQDKMFSKKGDYISSPSIIVQILYINFLIINIALLWVHLYSATFEIKYY